VSPLRHILPTWDNLVLRKPGKFSNNESLFASAYPGSNPGVGAFLFISIQKN